MIISQKHKNIPYVTGATGLSAEILALVYLGERALWLD